MAKNKKSSQSNDHHHNKTPPPTIDPFLERESQKYPKPIPSREFILMHLDYADAPLNLEAIAERVNTNDEETFDALRRRLRAMEREGQVIRTRRGDYGIADKMDLVRGRVMGHPDGFGFLIPDEGGEDVFLSERQMRTLLHGDRALVSIVGRDRKGRPEGRVEDVLERHNQEIVGRFVQHRRLCFVEPNNRRIHQDIVVPADGRRKAKNGQIVVVRLTEQPSRQYPPIGEVAEILGTEAAPGMEIDIAIRAHDIPHQWSEELQAEAAKFKPEVPKKAKKGREDLRTTPFVTIDGEDARDFDDAVYCEPRGKGWRLLVAIADVAAYVKPETVLDVEAQQRGNSVYFPNRVVPMLPEILSNGLCSLNPEVDRLSMVCELLIDARGTLRSTKFHEAVIRSHARLTYTTVGRVLEGEREGFSHPELLVAY